MSSRSNSGWLILIVFLGVLIGIVGGGLMGGVAGYYMARQNPVVLPAQVASQNVASTPAQQQPPSVTNLTVNQTSALIDTVKKVEPAVVTVLNTLERQPTPLGSFSPQASGSGVIIDEQGHIVTNEHVVEGTRQLTVIFSDGSRAEATVVGADPVSDLAVLKYDGKIPAFASLGDSTKLQLGETVIAIGSPLGNYRGSVTVGVISGMNRRVATQEGLIQTDAAINHGNSGGPLINLLGQVIGINTLVVRDTTGGDVAEGLGFAIPAETVQTVTEKLIANGKIDYPFIGIRYQEVTPQLASENNLPSRDGVIVQEVTGGSPAAQAGIRVNDILLALDDNKIDEDHTLRSILSKYHVGDPVTLHVMRGGQTLQIKITLAPRQD